jgi:hypothetical protein
MSRWKWCASLMMWIGLGVVQSFVIAPHIQLISQTDNIDHSAADRRAGRRICFRHPDFLHRTVHGEL